MTGWLPLLTGTGHDCEQMTASSAYLARHLQDVPALLDLPSCFRSCCFCWVVDFIEVDLASSVEERSLRSERRRATQRL